MSAIRPGRWRAEARVSFSDAAANTTSVDLSRAIVSEFGARPDNTGGMLASDAASNPNVQIVQERTHGRVTVTVAVLLDVSGDAPWDRLAIANRFANSFLTANCAQGTAFAQIQSVLMNGRQVSSEPNAPVTTGAMTLTRTGGYAVGSTAARVYRPITSTPSGVPVVTGKGGATVSYTPEQLRDQYVAKGARLFDLGVTVDTPSPAGETVEPASIPLLERVKLGAIVSATDGSTGKSAFIASGEAIADTNRSTLGRIALAFGLAAAVIGVVMIVRDA